MKRTQVSKCLTHGIKRVSSRDDDLSGRRSPSCRMDVMRLTDLLNGGCMMNAKTFHTCSRIFSAVLLLVLFCLGGPCMADDLLAAAALAPAKEVHSLLIAGADPNVSDDCGFTPLHLAIRSGRLETVQLLIQHGADVDACDNGGWTLLHESAQAGQSEAARLLLSAGADVNARNIVGETPLHDAAANGQSEVAALLVAGGADPEASDNEGWSPLMVAEYFDQPAVTEVLTGRGPDDAVLNTVAR